MKKIFNKSELKDGFEYLLGTRSGQDISWKVYKWSQDKSLFLNQGHLRTEVREADWGDNIRLWNEVNLIVP